MIVGVLVALLASGSGPGGTIAPATEVPLHVGATLRGEFPYRVRGSLSLGVLPDPYLDLINASAVAAGAYDEDTARVIKASLKQSLVVRLGGGWRPFARRGFHMELEYTHLSLGGDVASEDLIALATGRAPPDGGGAEGRTYDVRSTLTLLGGSAGWEWTLRARPIRIRAAVGFATTVAAETTVEPKFQPVLPGLVKVFTDECERYLDDVYLDYVHLPVASISAGWAF